MTNTLFEIVLMLAALVGAVRLFGHRDRPGLDFVCAALLIVVPAAFFGAIRYGGYPTHLVVLANETISLMAMILGPSWTIAAIVILLRGQPGRMALGVLWLLPAIIVPLAVAEATAPVGDIYAQMASLVMLVLMLAAGIVIAIRGSVAAGAGFIVGAAGYAGAALASMGFYGLSASTSMDVFHIGLAIWAAGLAYGALATDAVKRRDEAHSV